MTDETRKALDAECDWFMALLEGPLALAQKCDEVRRRKHERKPKPVVDTQTPTRHEYTLAAKK